MLRVIPIVFLLVLISCQKRKERKTIVVDAISTIKTKELSYDTTIVIPPYSVNFDFKETFYYSDSLMSISVKDSLGVKKVALYRKEQSVIAKKIIKNTEHTKTEKQKATYIQTPKPNKYNYWLILLGLAFLILTILTYGKRRID